MNSLPPAPMEDPPQTEERTGGGDAARAEELREAVISSVHTYQRALQDQLNQYRAQRAWKVMLFFRKAYTQLVRKGWQGRWEFIARGVRQLFGAPSDLDFFELTFPDLWNYLPDSLFVPTSAPAPRVLSGGETPAAKPDVFILPPFDFQFRFQRPQQLAAALARSGHRVIWVSPSAAASADRISVLRDNIWELRLPVELDLYQGELEEQQLARFESELEGVARSLGVAESWVLVQFPFWRRLALRLREKLASTVVYDCLDNWRHWTAKPAIGEQNLVEEQRLVAECDVLIASSKALEQQLSGDGRRAFVVPNAADFAFFNSLPEPDSVTPNHDRPVIGYYGALAEWFDANLVAAVAGMRPDYSFVLIGDTRDRELPELRALANVKFLGEKHYREIRTLLSDFDVCMIPFSITDVTRAVNPVKMYEYLSQGKPIVATRMPELERCGDLLYLAGNPQEFAACIDRALQENSAEIQSRRIAFAAQNTWQHRSEAIEAAVADSLPLVSIIVLTHNSLEFLGPFLRSIERNTSYPRYEVICVDNNSSDGTQAALKSITDPRNPSGAERREHGVCPGEQSGRGNGGRGIPGVHESRYPGDARMGGPPDAAITPRFLDRGLRTRHKFLRK